MSFKAFFAAALLVASPALAGEIEITDAYARSASPVAKTGAAFLVIENHGAADRLLSVASPAAQLVQLHDHVDAGDGVLQMRHSEDGFELPEEGVLTLERGGKHVMFMGLTQPFREGESVPLTLTFEQAGDVVIEVPVDLQRSEMGGHDHSGHAAQSDHSGHGSTE